MNHYWVSWTSSRMSTKTNTPRSNPSTTPIFSFMNMSCATPSLTRVSSRISSGKPLSINCTNYSSKSVKGSFRSSIFLISILGISLRPNEYSITCYFIFFYSNLLFYSTFIIFNFYPHFGIDWSFVAHNWCKFIFILFVQIYSYLILANLFVCDSNKFIFYFICLSIKNKNVTDPKVRRKESQSHSPLPKPNLKSK